MNAGARPISPEELLAHADWLRRLAARLVHDPDRAQDVAQETWARALETPPRRRDNLRGWLATAARRVAQQTGRSETARADRERRAARDPRVPSAAEVLEQASLQHDLAARVLELDEPYRTALLLRYYRDLSPARIAEELNLPRNTVRSHLARGLVLLRARLDARAGGREAWLRALTPLAALAPDPGKFAWTPLLAGVAAAAGALALGVQLARAPAPAGSGAQLASSQPAALLSTARAGGSPPAVAEPSERAREALAAAPSTDPAPGGVLDLRFVDADTGTPLAGLEFCVFKERHGNQLFQRGTADERGEARVGNLPANTILVQSARRPPHAIGFGAVWLRADERRALEVRVGRGGRIVGRAVDDLGTPVAGLDVALFGGPCAYRAGPPGPLETVARTDADGRFVVDAVGELPRGVWIVDGEPRPETWLAQRLTFRSQRFGSWPLVTAAGVVRTGEELDVGEVVVPRAVVYAGVVVDGGGRPVAGALVSANPERTDFAGTPRGPVLPGAAGFELTPGESLTDAEGAFRIEAPWSSTRRMLTVWTLAGGRARFPAPGDVKPAGVRSDLRLALPIADVLTFDLRGPDGERVDTAAFGPSLRQYGRYPLVALFGRANVVVTTADGELLELAQTLDADGLLRLSTDLAPRDVRAVDVFTRGYLPGHVDLPEGFPAEPLVVALRPQPRVRVRLALTAGGELPPGETLRVRVCACRAGVEAIAVKDRYGRCCGFGSSVEVELDGAPVDVDLPVVTDEPYWITVYANAARQRIPGRVLGPVRPTPGSAARFEVVVDPRELEPYEPTAVATAREERAPPAPAEPSTARAPDRSATLADLGYVEVADEPAARSELTIRLLEADGAPVAEGTDALLIPVDGETWGWEGRVEADGIVRFEGELPPRLMLAANTELGGLFGSSPSDRGFQLLDVGAWSPGVRRELRLAPWRTIEVVVSGLRDEDSALRASLRVSPPDELVPRAPNRPQVNRGMREIAATAPRTRHFRLEVPAGTWIVHGGAGLLEVPPTTIEVRDVEGTQSFETRVRRR